ncbi:TolC family protein [Roseiconus nitratireducens]|uniref:TolC family protein n=1 Tax=Roseiconus nitratireducens TaxID=2605748 RepID=UPI001F359653|nr:TolC family protein [Roseiconus nitratireducens]
MPPFACGTTGCTAPGGGNEFQSISAANTDLTADSDLVANHPGLSRVGASSPDGEVAVPEENAAPFMTEVAPATYEDGFLTPPTADLPESDPQTKATEFGTLVSQEAPIPTLDAPGDEQPISAAGQNEPSNMVRAEGQPIEALVSQALASHPRIQAARQRVAAATNVIPQARALPDPSFSNTFWPLHDQALQTAAGRIGNQMSLNQQIPYPEKLRSKARVASREVQIAQAEVEAIEREITESVRLAYYEVWFNTRAIEILEETKLLVDDLTEVAEARYKAGGSQQDVLRAQLENDRLDDQLVNLRKQKAVAQADLAALLQQPVGLIPETTAELDASASPTDIQSLIALAEQCNPSLRGLSWEIQRDREKQQLACLQQYPDFNVGVHWGLVNDNNDVISPVANGHDNLSFTFGTTLPIWREKINAGIREAGHRTASTTRRLEATRDEIYGKLRRLMAQADALIEQRDIYRERIVPRTEDTLKLAIADYRGERTDFFTLIETYRELLMFETQLARIEASLAGSVAQIDRTVGCPFSE